MSEIEIDKVSGKIPASRRKIIYAVKDLWRNPEVVPLLNKAKELYIEAGTNPSRQEASRAEEELDIILLDLSKQKNLPIEDIRLLITSEDDLSEDSTVFMKSETIELETPVTDLLSRNKQNLSPAEEAKRRNFPVRLNISSHASERDIINFVKKHMDDIRTYQRIASKKKIDGRLRMHEDLDDLIYKTLELKPKDAKEEINRILEERGTSKRVGLWLVYDRRRRVKGQAKKLGV